MIIVKNPIQQASCFSFCSVCPESFISQFHKLLLHLFINFCFPPNCWMPMSSSPKSKTVESDVRICGTDIPTVNAQIKSRNK